MNTTRSTETTPITPNMKIGDVLKEYPALLDVLVAQSPHFSRLKNPILRRIHGRLVTVAQAAAIVGIDPGALVRTLRKAAGQDSADGETEGFRSALSSMEGTPQPPWIGTAPIVAQLDVREDQRNHADPFAKIMSAAARVENGQVLLLRNTFEPLPLYDVLGRKGFVAWARKLAAEDWEVYFLKAGTAESDADPGNGKYGGIKAPGADEIDTSAPTATISIDVRDLTPPQPMMKILDGLANLKPGEVLLVHHRRYPVHLYPKLGEMGYTHKTVEKGPDQVDIYIRKA